MFKSKKDETEQRFYVKSTDDLPSFGRVTVLVDRQTGVNYLHTWAGTGSGITALLGKDGNVIVDEI